MDDYIMAGVADGGAVAAPGNASAVNWGAVFAGGVSAAAVAAILGIFGAGLGLASLSPWHGQGVSLTSFTVLAAIWLIIVQWVAALVGGYMAGRLRTKYAAIHTDEVFFRDTAHGFLAWALAVLFMVAAAGAAGDRAAAPGAAAAASATTLPAAYYTDLLFRQPAGTEAAAATPAGAPPAGSVSPGSQPADATPQPAASPATAAPPDAELYRQAGTILAEQATQNSVPADDAAYLARLVSEKTGLSPADAQARVTDVLNREAADINKTKQLADTARKAASGALIYTFVSLLIGAFIASVAGALGGRLRDQY